MPRGSQACLLSSFEAPKVFRRSIWIDLFKDSSRYVSQFCIYLGIDAAAEPELITEVSRTNQHSTYIYVHVV